MTKRTSNQLRIYRESPPEKAPGQPDVSPSLADLCQGFGAATGWNLDFVPGPFAPGRPEPAWSAPVGSGDPDGAAGLLTLVPSDEKQAARPALSLDAARQLATPLAEMLSELESARHALWQREAELAAGVPVVVRPDEPAHLAARLEAVLKGGAELVGARAAALYMLDAATTELKLRAMWGLAPDRFTEPPRPLRGAVADLEALAGHAVVLEDDTLMNYWPVPETCGAAVCVPVATSATPLGTLWIICDEPRAFSDRETNQIEIIAGRLAADLEREMLLSEGAGTQNLQRQIAEAERLQLSQRPCVRPLLDGWDLAGWTRQAESLGGDFHDWSVLADGSLAISVGDAMERGAAASLVASSLQTAIRAHAQYQHDPAQLLASVNTTLWSASAGDQFAAALFAKIDPDSGNLQLATAGQVGCLLLHGDTWQSPAQPGIPLAVQPESEYCPIQAMLPPGSVLVAFTDGVAEAVDHEGRRFADTLLAEALQPHLDQPAAALANMIADLLEGHSAAPLQDDQTVLVVQRKCCRQDSSRP